LAGNESGPARSATVLGIIVGKHKPGMCQFIKIGCCITNNTLPIGTDVRETYIIPKMTRMFGFDWACKIAVA
jgi:hypothetical protein